MKDEQGPWVWKPCRIAILGVLSPIFLYRTLKNPQGNKRLLFGFNERHMACIFVASGRPHRNLWLTNRSRYVPDRLDRLGFSAIPGQRFMFPALVIHIWAVLRTPANLTHYAEMRSGSICATSFIHSELPCIGFVSWSQTRSVGRGYPVLHPLLHWHTSLSALCGPFFIKVNLVRTFSWFECGTTFQKLLICNVSTFLSIPSFHCLDSKTFKVHVALVSLPCYVRKTCLMVNYASTLLSLLGSLLTVSLDCS